MIPVNFHTHTVRCMHAFGTEEEMVLSAIEAGIKELGFSDHCPIPFKTDYVSGIRMTCGQADEYVKCIRDLAHKYKEQIEIFVGFECEYVPEFFDEEMEMFENLGVDYLIMGEHFIDNEETGRYSGHEFTDEEFLARYVDTIIEGAKTGKYLYIAHPDIINYVGDTNIYKKYMTKLCRALNELDIPLEVNALGIVNNKQYPKDLFWDIVAEVGNKVVIGMDAHDPEMIKNQEAYDQCLAILEERNIGLTVLSLHKK